MLEALGAAVVQSLYVVYSRVEIFATLTVLWTTFMLAGLSLEWRFLRETESVSVP